ncbi:glutamate-cysteine ligase family protein [Azospirillum doebereinerae]|uniref:glutamate-cysteine ligase family protein n=2 Tax=Azospirillum doebereinerae TaxID=92933 RepID=UPI00384AEB0B
MDAHAPRRQAMAEPSLGLELEFAVVERTGGGTHDAGAVFHTLRQRRTALGEPVTDMTGGGRLMGLYGPDGVFSVDNGFNNLEYAFAPIGRQFGHDGGGHLNRLARIVRREVNAVLDALADNGAAALNLAEHPATVIDEALYRRIRAPKPIYTHWVEDRGWRHDQGIDAKAQNGPTTGVTADGAVPALNLILWAAPAMIALFANSPFEAGAPTGLLENRLTLWPRMFGAAHAPGDRRLHQPPPEPFTDLAGYFRWMHGPGTAMQVIPAGRGGYKGYDTMLRIEGDPPLFDFLAGPPRMARPLGGGEARLVRPDAAHAEHQQFAQFLDARIRFRFEETPPLGDFLAALEGAGALEALFARCGADLYIEGRACGANFPDAELLDLPDPRIAASVVLAPAALQKGLMANPQAWARLSALAPWEALPALRDAAIRDGLRGEGAGLTLRAFANRVVEEAALGLADEEHWMLAYPLHALTAGRNGADRALARYEALCGHPAERIRRIAAERIAHPMPALPQEAGESVA